MGTDLQKHFLKFTQDFQRLEAQKQAAVDNGDMTEEEFAEWRKNKLLYGMHWRRLVDRNTNEMLKYNQTAIRYINGEVPQIYASGYNSVAEQIPDSPVAGFDFELINADTVKNLIHEKGIILPPKKKVDPEKDKTWNAKQINAQLLQGIMAGESIPDIAKRMQKVANADLVGATRTARTMHTAAQNAGRQSGYNRAKEQGIIFVKTWLAAVDQYTGGKEGTRYTHYKLHGTTIPCDEKFVTEAGNELEFPGDWRAPGEEVYNCRCTMITKFQGFMTLKEAEEVEHREIPRGYDPDELVNAERLSERPDDGQQSKRRETEDIPAVSASSKKEAEQYAVDNGFAKYVNYGKLKLESMNIINQTLGEMRAKFPTKTLEKIKYDSSLTSSLAKAGYKTILIAPDNKHEKKNYPRLKRMYENAIAFVNNSDKPEKEKKDLLRKYNKALDSVTKTLRYRCVQVLDDDLKATVIHEYGHVVADQYFGQINGIYANPNANNDKCRECRMSVIDALKRARSNGDIYNLSEYANDSEVEFFAECFAMYNIPEEKEYLPDYIAEMIEEVTKNGIL